MAENIGALLLEGLQAAFNSGLYTDLVITCGPDRYNVHKVLICPNVEFFHNALAFPGKEDKTGHIDLPDDEPSIIKLVVQFLYEGEYNPQLSKRSKEQQLKSYAASSESTISVLTFPHTCTPSMSNRGNIKEKCSNNHVCPHHTCGSHCLTGCRGFTCSHCITIANEFEHKNCTNGPEDLLLHAKMYAVAEKYGVKGLKNLARTKFALTCNLFWDSEAFGIAARYVHESTIDTDQGLRDVVHKTICEHIKIIQKEEISSLLDDFGLAKSILMAKMEANNWR